PDGGRAARGDALLRLRQHRRDAHEGRVRRDHFIGHPREPRPRRADHEGSAELPRRMTPTASSTALAADAGKRRAAMPFIMVTVLATALWMLIVVRLFSGAMQSNASVANAYVADITPPEQRARRFGMLGAMFGLGFILGPVMGGLLGAIDLRLPFFAAGALAL